MHGIADNKEINPKPGQLSTDIYLTRDYNRGLKIDYKGDEVTPENFLSVIRGDEQNIKVGTRRVLNR